MSRVSVLTLGLLALCCLTTGQQQPGGQLPGGQQPGGQLPGGQQPGGQLPGGQQPGGQEQPRGQQQPGGQEVTQPCPQDQVIPQCLNRNCASYTVVERTKDYELRQYGPSKWLSFYYEEWPGAKTWNSSQQAFDRLRNYFKRNNSRGFNMLMTLPVLRKVTPTVNGSNQVVMHFLLPFQFWDNPPEPLDSNITIYSPSPFNVYVRSFGGFATEARWAAELAALKASLEPALYVAHFHLTAGYDPPWTQTGRRNEVMVVTENFELPIDQDGKDRFFV